MKNTKELIDLLHLDDLENNTFSGKSVTIGGADDVNFLRCELFREVFLPIHTSIC